MRRFHIFLGSSMGHSRALIGARAGPLWRRPTARPARGAGGLDWGGSWAALRALEAAVEGAGGSEGVSEPPLRGADTCI